MSVNLQFYQNKVDASNQVSFPYYFDGDDPENAKLKVMFVGNSITIHEPKPEINWVNKCGMAASDVDHDYVHLVYSFLKQKYHSVSICVFNLSHWERDYLNNQKLESVKECFNGFNPNVLIIRLGENFNQEFLKDGIDPYDAFSALINSFDKHKTKIFITSLFWRNDVIDNAIKKAANDYHLNYVDIRDLGDDKKYMAFSQYPEKEIFLNHPGDLGMNEIANRIIKELKNEF